MTNETRNLYLDSLIAGQPLVPAGRLAWLRELRSRALERAHALTVPSVRDEAWRFTDLSPLYKLAFRPATTPVVPAASAVAGAFAPEASVRLVFVDGIYSPALSQTAPVAGLTVASFSDGIEAHADVVRSRLGTLSGWQDDPFAAINTAYLHEGVLIVAERAAAVAAPIQLIFLSTQAGVATHPRVLVVARPGSDVLVLEQHLASCDGALCVNAITEIFVESGARVRHVRLQRDNAESFHLGTVAAHVERDGRFESNALALGARISRSNVNVVLDGEGAHASLDGLALIGGRQLADTHTFVDHAKPHGRSRQLHKCVVADAAHAVFNGRVLVRRGALLTDSAQSSRNLLLSERAHVDTKPQLEILADDVKCSHGATVGQLDAEELFYLRSRGLTERVARGLLTYGFAAEIVGRVPIPSVAQALRDAVLEQTHTKELS